MNTEKLECSVDKVEYYTKSHTFQGTTYVNGIAYTEIDGELIEIPLDKLEETIEHNRNNYFKAFNPA